MNRPWPVRLLQVTPVTREVQVNGPRNGRHYVWITHLYERRGDRYEFVKTEETSVSAWVIPWPPRAALRDG